MDWQLKLMEILTCIADVEGTFFEKHWNRYGVTVDEEKIIETAWDAYYLAQHPDLPRGLEP